MKNIYDDLMNRYIDNELNGEDLKNVENLIEEDSKFKSDLITHKYVHNNLYDLPIQNAPINITENIMNKIISKLSEKYKKNYFFRGIFISLSIIFITVLFMFFFYVGDLKIVQDSFNYTNSLKTYGESAVDFLAKILSTDIFKIISTLFSFIILVGFYFSLNSYKGFKERLKQF